MRSCSVHGRSEAGSARLHHYGRASDAPHFRGAQRPHSRRTCAAHRRTAASRSWRLVQRPAEGCPMSALPTSPQGRQRPAASRRRAAARPRRAAIVSSRSPAAACRRATRQLACPPSHLRTRFQMRSAPEWGRRRQRPGGHASGSRLEEPRPIVTQRIGAQQQLGVPWHLPNIAQFLRVPTQPLPSVRSQVIPSILYFAEFLHLCGCSLASCGAHKPQGAHLTTAADGICQFRLGKGGRSPLPCAKA